MTPTPIRQVLSTFQKSGVRTLLMGGQACVFYGAAQVRKDIDLLVLAEPENFSRLRAALAELQPDRIAVPPFDPAALARGHAVHFRCRAPGAEGLRVDVTARLRAMPYVLAVAVLMSGVAPWAWRAGESEQPEAGREPGGAVGGRAFHRMIRGPSCAPRLRPE